MASQQLHDKLTYEQYESALKITSILCEIGHRDYSQDELPEDEDIRYGEGWVEIQDDSGRWWSEADAETAQYENIPEFLTDWKND